MAFVNLSVELVGADVAQLNSKLGLDSTKPQESLANILNVLSALQAGAGDGQILVAVRATDAAVAASGGGASATLNLK